MSDMESQLPAPAKNSAAIARRATARAVAALLLLAMGVVTVRGLERAMNATFEKPPAPLRKPLPEMAQKFGTDIQFTATGQDQVMAVEMTETLGTTDYLIRRYAGASSVPGKAGSQVTLNLNYYATGSSTPHVPEICWAANGLNEVVDSRQNFDVKDVKHADGTVSDLRMRLISFTPPKEYQVGSESGEPVYVNVAYVFHVNGKYVASPQEVLSHFWTASNKFAYHCKIEVSPQNPVDGKLLVCTQKQAREIVSDFIREALPQVESCLPDPAILTQGESAEPNGSAIK